MSEFRSDREKSAGQPSSRERWLRLLALSILGLTLAATIRPVAGVSGFGDVSKEAFYTEAVQWMVDEGITQGTSATCFSPGEELSRVCTLFHLRGPHEVAGTGLHPQCT